MPKHRVVGMRKLILIFSILILLPCAGYSFQIQDLSQYQNIVVKEMTMTDTLHATNRSNNAQIRGVKSVTNLLGNRSMDFQTRYVYMGRAIAEEYGLAKWYYYDTSTPNKLNYDRNEVMQSARAGDTAVIARKSDNEILILVVKADSKHHKELMQFLSGTQEERRSFWSRLTQQKEDTPPTAIVPKKDWMELQVYFTPGTECEDGIMERIDTAQKMDIAIYAFTNQRIADALLAAHKRGAKIRMVTDRLQSHGRGSQISGLRDAGIPIRINHGKHKI